jgi:hypothetical protein
MTHKQILKIKFRSDDLSKTLTIEGYLKELLHTLFIEGDGFSGKRPFGNSGWEHDLELALINNKIINGTLDEDGFISSSDGIDDIIHDLIKAM